MDFNMHTQEKHTINGMDYIQIPPGYRLDPASLIPDGKCKLITLEKYEELYRHTTRQLTVANKTAAIGVCSERK